MAITLIERPYDVNWSKNPIRYTLQTNTDLDTAGLYIQLAVHFSVFGANNFGEVVVLSLFPDKSGVCSADIANILNGMLSYYMPTIGADVEKATGQNGDFKIKYREVTDAAPNSAWTDDVARTVIKGGMSYEKWRGPNFFTSYMPANKPFLTWQKSGTLCKVEQPLYLFFLQSADSAGQILATFKVHYTDGTEATKIMNVGDGSQTAAWTLWCIPSGIDQAGLAALQPSKMIHWYEVSVKDNSGILAAAYRYEPDYRFFDRIFSFNYINSLGGIDAIRILGEWEQTQERSFEALETFNEKYFLDDNEVDARIRQENHSEKISYKGNAGFIEDPRVLDSYRELMLSSRVMEQIEGRWIFVLITSDKTGFGFKKYENELMTLPVEWRYSFENRSYTPMGIAIGGLPTCPVPTDLQSITNAGVVTISWTGMAGNNSFVIELSGWTKTPDPPGPIEGTPYHVDWFIYGSTTGNTYNIDISSWIDLYVRVKAICAASSSNYTNELKIL